VHPGPLPSPGVFARHNAVDTPALLPDGTAAEASISRVLAARGTVRSAPADVDVVFRQITGSALAQEAAHPSPPPAEEGSPRTSVVPEPDGRGGS
jgi:NADH-quinone oxidoreductase subunit J